MPDQLQQVGTHERVPSGEHHDGARRSQRAEIVEDRGDLVARKLIGVAFSLRLGAAVATGQLARPRQLEKHQERALADVVAQVSQTGRGGVNGGRGVVAPPDRLAGRTTPARIAALSGPTFRRRFARGWPLFCRFFQWLAAVTESRKADAGGSRPGNRPVHHGSSLAGFPGGSRRAVPG